MLKKHFQGGSPPQHPLLGPAPGSFQPYSGALFGTLTSSAISQCFSFCSQREEGRGRAKSSSWPRGSLPWDLNAALAHSHTYMRCTWTARGTKTHSTSTMWLSSAAVARDHCADNGPIPIMGLRDKSKEVLGSSVLQGGHSPRQKHPLLEASYRNTAVTRSESYPGKQMVGNAIAQARSLISLDWGHGDFCSTKLVLPSPALSPGTCGIPAPSGGQSGLTISQDP